MTKRKMNFLESGNGTLIFTIFAGLVVIASGIMQWAEKKADQRKSAESQSLNYCYSS